MDRRTARYAGLLAAGAAVGAAGLLAGAGDAVAGPKELSRKKKAAVVGRAEVPLGLQGLRGAGGNVIVPFTLVDASRANTDVEVQYGIDLNSDGVIADDEFVRATEDRLDPRNTRRNRKPQLWVTAGDIGATHAFAWRSTSDVLTGRAETLLYMVTDQGRKIPDVNNPGEFLFEPAQAGVRIRLRAVRGTGKKRLVGEWALTDAFSLNNNTAPTMTIDSVDPNDTGAASDENVFIHWTGFDPDSEDADNDGVFDPGEDTNGNGVFDQEQFGVAFDYYRLQPGDDPSTMTEEQIAALPWQPCTRAAGLGDSDSLRETGAGKVFGSPGGRSWTFVWNSVADVGSIRDRFILRAAPIDSKKENGSHVYLRSPIQLDNWKIFTSGAAGNDAIALSSGRVGCTVTNLVYGLDRSDAAYGKPFQQVIVAGGSTSATGAPVTNVELFLVNSETADTTAAVAVPFTLQAARRFHTATLLADGRVLFAGGFDAAGNPLASTEIYDPATRTLTAGPALNTARGRHTAVLLSTNDVAFIGGVGAGNAVLGSIELVRPAPHGTPSPAATTLPAGLGTPMHSARAVLLPDQQVLIAGGITTPDLTGAPAVSAYILDPLAGPTNAGAPGQVKPKTPTVIEIAGPATPRKFAGFTSLHDGNVLVSGGVSGGAVQASLEVFDWHTHTFAPVNLPMPDGGRAQHVAALLGDGSVVLAGGATTDPSGATPQVTGAADVFRLGAFAAGAWDGQFLPVNGEMVTPRRGAAVAVLMNGRPFIAGGQDATGSTVATCEVYTPDNSRNFAPHVYVALPTAQLSHQYGATVYYRLVDGENDRARVQVQFRIPGGSDWNACTPQSETIGGDVAEDAADLQTTTQDVDHDVLAIDPVAKNTLGDHSYIWSMASDIDRPEPGQTIAGYNLRVIPFGAVRGAEDVSDPVTVLYNTKAVTYFVPLEDAIGDENPFQGGDIRLWVHVRDIDGAGSGPREGDPCSVRFEYAVDTNNDGQISAANNEFFLPMTPAGAPTGNNLQENPVVGVTSWSESPFDATSDITTRPSDRGWLAFDWDALYDLGTPSSLLDFEQRNIWVRIVANDTDEGFPKVVRNRPGQPEEFVYVRDAEAIWLDTAAPAGGNLNSVKVNEPLVFTFNGNLDPATVGPQTIRIYRGGTQILGAYQVENDTPAAGQTRVTFHPTAQNLSNGSLVYGVNDSSTILFPFNEYRIEVPGYGQGDDPADDSVPTIRPLDWQSETSTFAMVHSSVIQGDVDSRYRFSTSSGYYDNGRPVARTTTTPVSGGTLAGPAATSGFSLSYSHAIDVATVASPNITVRGASGQTYVVPGRWSVLNTTNADGTSSSVLTFTPLFKLPSSDSLSVTTAAGFRGTNGRSDSTAQPVAQFTVSAYGRTSTSYTETFTNTAQEDTAYVPPSPNTRAVWGADPCAGGTLTGLQDGSTAPSGALGNLTVSSGQTVTLSLNTYDYANITVAKGGTLVLRSTNGPMTLRATGTVTIDGVVDFSGAEGDSGAHGKNTTGYSSSSGIQLSSSTGTRRGGTGYNGGGSGGDSDNTLGVMEVGDNGASGTGTTGTGGQGGGRPNTASSSAGSTTSVYYYGCGGGAGGGNATSGIRGGPPGFSLSSPYPPNGSFSTPGSAGGSPDFASGINGGGGGGGGGTSVYATAATGTQYFHLGGGGGAGAGGVTIHCTGAFTLGPTGYINGQGGQGGTKAHYGGAGGGGAGGSLWIKAGGTVQLNGVIDLRGGRGGPPGYAYYGDSYAFYGGSTQGTARYGGDGGLGRLYVQGPNYLPGQVDEVRVFGQLTVNQVASIPSTTGYTTPPSQFSTSGGTGVQTLALAAATDVRYTSLDIPTGRTVYLTNQSGTTNRALRIWVSGNVNISGTLKINGNGAGFFNTSSYTVTGDYAPIDFYSQIAVLDFFRYYYYPTTTSYATAYTGGPGGGAGGIHIGNSAAGHPYRYEAYDGGGIASAAGKHKIRSGGGGYSSYIWCGDGGGGGAGNATPGRPGWAPYAVSYSYNYQGAVLDTTGNGVSAATRLLDSAAGGAALDASTLTTDTIGNFPGSGGGGGNPCGYYNYYCGIAGNAGAGGGALAIICQGTVNLNTGSVIDASGGDGNPPGEAYQYYYANAAGGGGSGGTVLVSANSVYVAPVTIGEGGSANGATVNLKGGYGGGWRTPRSGIYNQNPWYNSQGHFGGDGGYGRLRIDYRTSLNSGRTLANRWGMEQTVFHDATNQYRALAGSARFACRGTVGGGHFRSKFLDLGSLRPQVSALTVGSVLNTGSFVLQGQGAQSHPHNLGAGGIGEPDANTVGALVNYGSMNYDGWRWWRFQGSFTRFSTTGSAPSIDNITTNYVRDN